MTWGILSWREKCRDSRTANIHLFKFFFFSVQAQALQARKLNRSPFHTIRHKPKLIVDCLREWQLGESARKASPRDGGASVTPKGSCEFIPPRDYSGSGFAAAARQVPPESHMGISQYLESESVIIQ